MKGLTDIPGILVGHATDHRRLTGCTVILCEGGAVAGVDVRGSATGTEEIELLRPPAVETHIHAVMLAGGSAFGLEAASGVRRFLEHRGIGFKTAYGVVPIVPGAILYDLGFARRRVRPTREMGEAAAAAATGDAVEEGAVGAGAGATVGKLFGMKQAMKSGVGTATVTLAGGAMVSALVVVNAFGDVRDPSTGKLIAGARRAPDSMELADTERQLIHGGAGAHPFGNTTLGVVATNVALSQAMATKLARQASLGMARTIYPVNTMADGDTIFGLSLGSENGNMMVLGPAAAEAMAQAVVRAVRSAPTSGGVPGLAPAA